MFVGTSPVPTLAFQRCPGPVLMGPSGKEVTLDGAGRGLKQAVGERRGCVSLCQESKEGFPEEEARSRRCGVI